jgi:hypothetical protein
VDKTKSGNAGALDHTHSLEWEEDRTSVQGPFPACCQYKGEQCSDIPQMLLLRFLCSLEFVHSLEYLIPTQVKNNRYVVSSLKYQRMTFPGQDSVVLLGSEAGHSVLRFGCLSEWLLGFAGCDR